MVYNVPVVTTVLCTSHVKILKGELVNGTSIYRVELVRLKDRNAENVFEKLERKMKKGKQLKRYDVFPVLLSPLMSGEMAMSEHTRNVVAPTSITEMPTGLSAVVLPPVAR